MAMLDEVWQIVVAQKKVTNCGGTKSDKLWWRKTTLVYILWCRVKNAAKMAPQHFQISCDSERELVSLLSCHCRHCCQFCCHCCCSCCHCQHCYHCRTYSGTPPKKFSLLCQQLLKLQTFELTVDLTDWLTRCHLSKIPHISVRKKKRRGHFEGLNGKVGSYGWCQLEGNRIN